jgi:hypothetical protein
MGNYGYIYRTEDLATNKVYIGKRKGEFNPKYYGSGVIIQRILRKYPQNRLNVTFIRYTESMDDLHSLEKAYISYYRQSIGSWNMYNIADGGQGGKTYERTKETNDKQRKAHLGKTVTIETRKKQSQLRLGVKLGPMTDAHKERLRGPRILTELRFCNCKCGKIFECKVNSHKHFIHGHNQRNIKKKTWVSVW